MGSLRADGPEESGVSGNVIHDILHYFHFKLGLSRDHAWLLIYSCTVFSFVFLLDGLGDRQEEMFLSFPEWEETDNMFFTFCSQHYSFFSFFSSLHH